MRLDHVSYAITQDQLVNVIQRMGSRVGSAFVDGGIHPRFGTRNFTLALKNGHYIEVVCPIDHPAADTTPFGRIVSRRASEGGGWLTWVVSTEDIAPIERRLGRQSVDAFRKRPDGSELKWRQLGVLGSMDDSQLPFFIQWLSDQHPSTEGKPVAEISKMEIAGDAFTLEKWLGTKLSSAIHGIEIEWCSKSDNDDETGLVAVHLSTPTGIVRLD